MSRPDFYSESTVRGRREYRCAHCPKPIAKGELHVSVSRCSCGEFSDWRAHTACHETATGQPAPAHASTRVSAAA